MESGHEEEEGPPDIPDAVKVKEFDQLLKRIEAERKRMTTNAESSTLQRLDTITTPRRAERGNPLSNNYDFASRARELRMSPDSVPARSGTPERSERDSKAKHFTQPARDMTPRSVGHRVLPSPIQRVSDGVPSYTPTARSESPSARHGFSNRARDTPPRSPSPRSSSRRAGNTPVRSSSPATRSSSPMRSYPPSPNQADFKIQVENFHSSLVSAHDTITTLEKDVRSLKRTVEEKEGCISSLEQSLNETLAKNRDDVNKIRKENFATVAENSSTISKRHIEELEKLQSECDGHKKHAGEIDKLSAERYATAKEIEREKHNLEGSVQDKEKMIGSLRNEIQRLNEELADGSFVRSQALKAEETSKKLEVELDKSKMDHASATKVIFELEMRLKKKSEEFEGGLKEKDKEIAILQSKLMGDNSMKQSSERMENKVCSLESQLHESELQNEEFSSKMKDLEKRLELAERAIKKKDKEKKRLEAWSESREKDLKRQLEKERQESVRQRERLDEIDTYGATEQETVAALERAIENLESAHNEGNSEIIRLQNENRSLATTLAEAEEYMKLYQYDIKDSRNLKSMLRELQDINSDLGQQVQSKDDQMRQSNERTKKLEMQIESSSVASKQKILDLAATLAEAEEYMKLHQHDIKESKNLKSMLGELQDINSDLDQQVQSKDDQMRQSNERMGKLEMQIESSSVASKQKILELEKLVARKQDDIFRLQREFATKRDSQVQEESTAKKLIALTTLFEDNKTELRKLRTNKGSMIRTIGRLEKELDEIQKEFKSHALGTKLDHDQVGKFQREAKRAWTRVGELEAHLKTLQGKLSVVEQKSNDGPKIEKLKSELASVKEKLAERDEQLTDSRKGIAEAQKMIFRLMNTVQEMRKKAREQDQPHLYT